jgi:hypothetical protein
MINSKSRVLNISMLVFLIYVLFAFVMYEYFYLNTITEYVCFPYTIAYGLAFQFGEVFFYISLFFESILLFSVLYWMVKIVLNMFSPNPSTRIPNDK